MSNDNKETKEVIKSLKKILHDKDKISYLLTRLITAEDDTVKELFAQAVLLLYLMEGSEIKEAFEEMDDEKAIKDWWKDNQTITIKGNGGMNTNDYYIWNDSSSGSNSLDSTIYNRSDYYTNTGTITVDTSYYDDLLKSIESLKDKDEN